MEKETRSRVLRNYNDYVDSQKESGNQLLNIDYVEYFTQEEIVELVELFKEKEIFNFTMSDCGEYMDILEAFVNSGYKMVGLTKVGIGNISCEEKFQRVPALELKLKQSRTSL